MNMYTTQKTTSGFTLIEVLVVVAIIGILSSVLYVSFGDARDNSRTKALQSEVKQVQLAIELYNAQNEEYPAALTDLVPEFIADLPVAADSANSSCSLDYLRGGGGDWYKLTADECIAGELELTTNDEMARCPSTCADCAGATLDESVASFNKSFAVYSFGGQCE